MHSDDDDDDTREEGETYHRHDGYPTPHKKGIAEEALNLFGITRWEAIGCFIISSIVIIVFIIALIYCLPLLESATSLGEDAIGDVADGLDNIGNGIVEGFEEVGYFVSTLECDVSDLLFGTSTCKQDAPLLPCCSSLSAQVLASYIGHGATKFCTVKNEGTRCQDYQQNKQCTRHIAAPLVSTPCSDKIIRLSSPIGTCENFALRTVINCQVAPEDTFTFFVDTSKFTGTNAGNAQRAPCSAWTTNTLLAGVARNFQDFCIASNDLNPCTYNSRLPNWIGHDVYPTTFVLQPSLLSCDGHGNRIAQVHNGVLVYTNNTPIINPATGRAFSGI